MPTTTTAKQVQAPDTFGVTFKNIQIHNGLSQETLAFTASVYLDGKRVGQVMNDGWGGSHMWQVPHDVREVIMERARQFAPHAKHEPDAFLVDALTSQHEYLRDAKSNKRAGFPVTVVVQRGYYSIMDGTSVDPASDHDSTWCTFAETLAIGLRSADDVPRLLEQEAAQQYQIIDLT